MNSQPPKLPSPKPEPGNLDASELSSNQEAVPIPWICGTRKLALTWVAPIFDMRAVKLVSPPPGIQDAMSIAQWFDPGAASLGGVGGVFTVAKGATGGRPSTTAYYGTLAGIVGAGPFDELVAVLMNSAVIWPTNKTWADGVIDIPTTRKSRKGGVAHVQFATEHALRKGQKFIMSGLTDAPNPGDSFNEATPKTVSNAGAQGIQYSSAGGDLAFTNDTGGLMSKVVHYVAGDLVKDGAAIWECTADHDGTPDKRPNTAGGAAFWSRYVVDRGSNPNPFAFSMPHFCEAAYWYWGTSDQTLDAAGEAFLSSTGHPPYRRQGVLVLKKLLLGTRPAAPNIEVIVRRKPNQTVIGGASAELDGDGQANPVAAFVDLHCHPAFGIGRPVAGVDAATFQAVADELQAIADKMYVSPILSNQQTFRQFVTLLAQYYDGWFRWSASAAIEAGRFLHNAAPPAFNDSTTLDFNDATDEISFTAEGWAETQNEVLVKFQDETRAYKDAAQKSYSGFNRQVVGEPRLTALERPFITREPQALGHAAEAVSVYSEPTLRGEIEVRKEKAESIKQGDLFLLTHDAAQLSVICRVIQKAIAAPPAGRATITFERERGIAVVPFQATGTPVTTTVPEDEDLSLSQIVQPPAALVNAQGFSVVVLGSRKSLVTHGIRVWFKADDADFLNLGQQVYFGVKGTLAQDFAINTGTSDDDTENLQITCDDFTLQDDLDRVSATQTEDAINADSIIVWISKASDPTQFEICTLKAIRLDSGVYKLKVRRGRFGTVQLDFNASDNVWIGYRSDLVPYTHQRFESYVESGAAATFRLQAFTASSDADLTDADLCPDIAFTFADVGKPEIAWNVTEMQRVSDAPNWVDVTTASPVLETTLFRFGFQADSIDDVIERVALVARLGSKQITISSHDVEAQRSATLVSGPFSLTDGTWEIYGVVTKASGTVTLKILFAGGANDLIVISPGTKTMAPIAVPSTGDINAPAGGGFPSDIVVGIATVEPGASTYTSLTAPSATGPGAWVLNVTTTLNIPIGYPGQGGGHSDRWSLWLKSTLGGKADSEFIRYEFWYKAP